MRMSKGPIYKRDPLRGVQGKRRGREGEERRKEKRLCWRPRASHESRGRFPSQLVSLVPGPQREGEVGTRVLFPFPWVSHRIRSTDGFFQSQIHRSKYPTSEAGRRKPLPFRR